MAFFGKKPQFPGTSYLRFLLFSAVGFFIGGITLLALGSFVFEPNHEAVDSHNVESIVAFSCGVLAVAISGLFAILLIMQYQKVKQMRTMANRMLLEGQENTLYQVFHQNTPLPKKPLVTMTGSPALTIEDPK